MYNFILFFSPAETGGVCIAPRPAEAGAEIRPAMAMRPFFGIEPALMDEKVKSALLLRTKLYRDYYEHFYSPCVTSTKT